MDRAPTNLSTALADAAGAAPDPHEELARAKLALAQAQDKLLQSESRLDIRNRELAVLRSSHELLVSTLDAANDGIITLQYSDGSIYFNIRFVELWGIPEDELSDMDNAKLVQFQMEQVSDPGAWAAHVERRRQNPDQEDFSLIEMKDGRVLERHVIPQRVHGKCVGSVITFRDVTERLRYEEKMMFNSLVVENSGPMVWVNPVEETLIYGNGAACEVLGYSADEIVGLGLPDVVADYTPGRATEMAARFREAAGKPLTYERPFRRKDGTIVDVEVTSFVARDDKRTLSIAAFKDITHQKRAEQEKKRQQATLDSLINSISDLIFYKDKQGRYMGCNTAYAALVGKPVAEIRGLTCHDLFAEEISQSMDARDAVCMSHLREQSSEYWVTYPDGQEALLDTVVSPLWDENGEPQGLLGISRDITTRVEMEEALRASREQLQALTRRQAELQ
ncbi:MAG: PAS domain S-box protein, partial [Ramlibacter sp.]